MRAFIQHFILLLITTTCYAQVVTETNPPENIKSIVFNGTTADQFPIVQLGEQITLEFDDLTASEQDYYYEIEHFDYNWTSSQLLKSQYLNGMDRQRIIDYVNSYNTLQPFSNYRLTIPNNEVSLKVTGNYMLLIYDSYDELVFSRRFIIYSNKVSVGMNIKRSRDFAYLNEKQVVQLTIETGGAQLVNPKKEVKIALLQNYYWPKMIPNIAPQYTIGSQLIYRYDRETSFFGGNEYYNFDTKDLRAPSAAISHISLYDVYEHHLFPNEPRNARAYTYFPDINGDFVIRTLQGGDNAREAEYTKVHFTLPYSSDFNLDDIYVFGKFNNYALGSENKMHYNEETGNLETSVLLKQGFYNYKYVRVNNAKKADLNSISGNFHITENHYLAIVYYRDFGGQYDGIIGIGSINSTEVSN